MTDKQQYYAESTDDNILLQADSATNPLHPYVLETRTHRPRAAIRRAARRGLTLAVDNKPASLHDGESADVAKERNRALQIVASQRLAERLGLVVNLELAITMGTTLASIHIGLTRLAIEGKLTLEQITAAGVMVLHRGRV